MKTLKKVLLVLLLAVTLMPIMANAEGKKKTTIYLFRGEGCPHCEEALEWFDSLDTKTKDKYELIQYETWHDKDNAELMKKVAKAMGENTSNLGVPYIVIGDKTFIGFAADYKEDILAQINALYGKEDAYDVMQHLTEEAPKEDNKKESTTVYVIIGFAVLAGVALAVVISKSK